MRWYPQDVVTYATIQTYLDLNRNSSHKQCLLVGIVYENDQIKRSSKLLEALLADPLSDRSGAWYPSVTMRPRDTSNMISCFGEEAELLLPEAFQRTTTKIFVGTPLLCGERRPEFPDVFPPHSTKANDIVLVEINTDADVPKLVDVCHFYIYVTSEFSTLMDSMPRHVQKKILLTVVDNSEYLPISSETTPVTFDLASHVQHHAIKIDSAKMVQGVDALINNGAIAGSSYFDGIQQSNILEVVKFILWFLRTENLSKWLYQVIRNEISHNTLSETYVKQVYEDLRLHAVAECSSSMHHEFQSSFVPDTQAFFDKKLRWWMLYWMNDNVEYALKDYMLTHFMPRSIAAYNYVKGQLVARLQEQKFAAYKNTFDVANPLAAFKLNLVNNRILAEIQPMVYSTLAWAFVTYQLPLTVLSFVGYMWLGIQPQTAIAITLLGWVLGFNEVSKRWQAFTEHWLKQLFEEVRLVISKGCIDNGLLKELNTRYEGAKDLARIRRQVLETLARHEE